MQIVARNIDGTLIVTISGRLNAIYSPELEEKLVRYIEMGNTNLVLDLSELEYISSAGLRVLIAIMRRIKSASGSIRLMNPCPDVREVIEMSGLEQLFQPGPSDNTGE